MFKKCLLFFIILFFSSASFAVSNSYEIVVATLKYQSGIAKIKRTFKNNSVFVYKKGDLFVVAIGVFDTKSSAEKKLKEIKKIYPSAFVRIMKKDVKKVKNKKAAYKYIIQIAVLSKKDGIAKIKNKFNDIDIRVDNLKNLYKVFAVAKSKKESFLILKKIRRYFPSAFIVGETSPKIKSNNIKQKAEKNGYIIFVGKFKDKEIDSILVDFVEEDSYLKRNGEYNYFYVVNIPSEEIADKKLQLIKQKYQNAKIVSSLEEKIEFETKEIKDEDNITKPSDMNITKNDINESKVIENNNTDNNVTKTIVIENNITEENITKTDENEQKVEEVFPQEIKEVNETNKTVIETVVKEYKEDKKKATPIDSTIIRKIRKNYVDFDKSEYK